MKNFLNWKILSQIPTTIGWMRKSGTEKIILFMEDLISTKYHSNHYLLPSISKKQLKTFKTSKGQNVEELNQKKLSILGKTFMFDI